MKTKTSEILRIRDLALSFNTEEGEVEALDGVTFDIEDGSVSGLIGETGCGKSVTGLAILGLLDQNARIKSGEIVYKGEDLLSKK
ncbi:MAG: ATP-binding cassette domain-containing protein, partial [Candidatus Acetothermia bacterium]